MAAATAVDFNPTRQGKFKVVIGDSLKPGAEESQASSNFSSFRYNTTPPEGISKLIKSDNGQFDLAYEDGKDTSYAGSQRPGRKLECVLVYNPKDNTFTLERMTSVFTFNQSHPTSDSAPIPLAATYDDEASGNVTDDEDAQLADAENPFDVRHFTARAQPESDEGEDDGKDNEAEDTDIEMEDADVQVSIMEPDQEQETALTPGPAASTPIPASSATPIPAPALPPLKRKLKKPVDPFMKPTRKPKAPPTTAKSPLLHPGIADDRKEASMSPQSALPSPMHGEQRISSLGRGRMVESSESDVDESDEDSDDGGAAAASRRRQPYNKNLQPAAMSREPSYTGSILSNRAEDVLDLPDPKSDEKGGDGGGDELDLWAAMEEEFDEMGNEDENMGGGDDLMIIEGESESRGIGLGINNVHTGAVPMSLSRMEGERREESEEESSEEE